MMPGDPLADLLAAHEARATLLRDAFDAAPTKVRNQVLLVDYRCRRHCSLLIAWQAPGHRLVALPPYRLSRERNEQQSVPSARRMRTTDGYRRWRGRVLLFDELFDGLVLDLKCDHTDGHVLVDQLGKDLASATPGQPTRRQFPLKGTAAC